MINGFTLLRKGLNFLGRLISVAPSENLCAKAATLVCAALAVNTSVEAQSTTFNYTGAVQTYTATSTGTLLIDMAGAKGGDQLPYALNAAGNGGRVVCSLAVTSGQVLNIYVGGMGQSSTSWVNNAGGFNGGGNGVRYGAHTYAPEW
jgi:hypothetical protein